MMKLVDVLDLGSSAFGRVGSSPTSGTNTPVVKLVDAPGLSPGVQYWTCRFDPCQGYK